MYKYTIIVTMQIRKNIYAYNKNYEKNQITIFKSLLKRFSAGSGECAIKDRRSDSYCGVLLFGALCFVGRSRQITTHARCFSLGYLVYLKPGVHTNDFASIYGRRAKKLGHASLATVFRPSRLTFQPIIRENMEATVVRSQPITTAVVPDPCLNTRWHHGAFINHRRWLP